MAYMNQERKAERAPAIKAILKEYGIKGSLSVRHHSTLVLNIKSGAIDFIGNHKNMVQDLPAYDNTDWSTVTDMDVNPYWYDRHFTGTAVECIRRLIEAMNGADYYCNDDAQTDYFDRSHYIDINIGDWNKPYQLTK